MLFSLVLFCVVLMGALPAQESPVAPGKLTKEKVEALYTNKVIEKLEFQQITPMEFVAWLKARGLPVEVSEDFEKTTNNTKVTLALKNVPAMEVVKYVTNLTNTRYEVKESHILLSPM